eukprot:TRINITY_DN37930_c0_g1_i1.p1 TRINITY_DN37930_c0_g1~~TRINITY_DN37930_c0_g1_i1.p1  ORF type:complete len:416 (+),score=57.61 TRINITY_DN37930_c0_g1_i1:47-1294(+)
MPDSLTCGVVPSREIYETLLDEMCRYIPSAWINLGYTGDLENLPLTGDDFLAGQARWDRLTPLIAQLWPAEAAHGRITSSLQRLHYSVPGLQAPAFVKLDSQLPVCASVKARGGLYEVLCHAEDLCMRAGLCAAAEHVTSARCAEFLAKHEVAVGSTGNLGLSVGLAAAAVGMRATVHMSTDAKAWKKTLLRERGVNVVEHEGLYEEAVAEGRRAAEKDPFCFFVDDERSKVLFLGYSAAARELADQLADAGIQITVEQPLVVYIPCGVGGAPGGICWGLKHVFGSRVHVFFAEPTHAPCVTLGLASQRFDGLCISDVGIDGVTAADGLAVGRASGLVCAMVSQLVAGTVTVDDSELSQHLTGLLAAGDEYMEPSCCAAFSCPARLRTTSQEVLLTRGTHVFWATGGALVPQHER